MQFKQGVPVFTDMGDQVGDISRIVIDPRTKEVAQVVVSKGAIFKEDKIVPLSLIGSTTESGIRLRPDAGNLEELPDFEEQHYVLATERVPGLENEAPALYWYPPAGIMQTGGYQPAVPGMAVVERHIPKEDVALEKGTKVISSDDQTVGHVSEVLTDMSTDHVTFFVIEKGLLNKEHKLIPSDWISQITDEEVRLAVNAQQIEQLREYAADNQNS